MTRFRLAMVAVIEILALAAPSSTVGQGVLVDVGVDHPIRLPRPIPLPPRVVPQPSPSSYRIDSLEVNAKLDDQVARVQVSQTFENTGSLPMEVSFVFPLPYDGAIDQLTLLVDGKEFEAELLSKEDARKRYEDIVRKNRDPADERVSDTGRREAHCYAAVLATSAQELWFDRLHLPAKHGQVHE